MKKHYTLLFLLFTFWSQAQNGITYQALILNPNSEELPGVDNSRLPFVNQNICLEFKIINATSKVDYQETLTTRTDEFGMVNVIIGTGTRKAGIATQFKNINWDGTAKNLVVSFDPTGNCNQFIEISNQPFTYVPYALYAANGGATGAQGPDGPAGTNGLDGKTILNGTNNPSASVGTNGDFYINTTTNSLFGPKANGLWGNGVTLVGPQGIQGLQGPQGVAGINGLNGINGINGSNGLSAYQIWLNAGNSGTEAQFLTSIQGPQGTQGPAGANGANGSNGLSAYQIWLNAGNTGTEAQFLTALRGATGAQGPQGIQGPTGPQGTAGTNGTNGSNGSNGLSTYQIWLNAGNTGTEAQFLTALRGATGAQGIQGIQGITGQQGTAGINGTNGVTWLSGTTTPSTNLGSLNDFYINTSNGEYFKKTAANIWTQQGNLTGPAGAQGTANSNGTANSIYWFKFSGVTNGYVENNINWKDFKYTSEFSSNNDIIHDSNTGEITFTKAGIYKVEYYVPGGGNNIFQGIQLLNYKNTTWNIITGINARNSYDFQDFRSDGIVLSVSAGEKIKVRVDGYAREISIIISQTGVTGPQGIAGTNGTNGNDGLSAYQIWLNAGNTGTEAQFLTALRGATGAQGIQGIQGVQGPTGPTGVTGPQGIAGINGVNGTNGTNGTNGANGNDGLSAYQIWINAGNTGTEAQFLTALRGATGPQGIQGIQGATGLTGAAGASGPQGIQGVAGPTGSTGSSGTNGLDGKTILNGNQDPVNSTGNNGDFYINTTANTLFGPKTSGAWGNGVSLVGPQGATGNNGKNTLVTTTVEAAGANCATGGTKIEVGLDVNSNGILDISEVISSLTKYVCNGTNSNLTSNGSFYSYDYVENDLFTFSQNNDPIQTTTIQTNQKNGYLKFNLKFRSGNGTPCGSLKIISSNNDILYQSSVNCTGWSQTIGISLNSSWNNISIVVTKTSSEQSGQLILSGNFEKVLFN